MENVEVWNSFLDYEGVYEASNLGNIKSLSRFRKNRKIGCISKDIILKPYLNNKGYYQVTLYLKGRVETFQIHQLVAIAFLNHTLCGYDLVVEHKNQITTDNRLENLKIITQRENSNKKHLKSISIYTGVTKSKGSKKWKAQINIDRKTKYLGSFDTELEASYCYENALKNHNLRLPIEVKRRKCYSNYEGVFWNKVIEKWFARITIDRKQKYLGSFISELKAYKAYQNALNNLKK